MFEFDFEFELFYGDDDPMVVIDYSRFLFRVGEFVKFDEFNEKLPVLSYWICGKYH